MKVAICALSQTNSLGYKNTRFFFGVIVDKNEIRLSIKLRFFSFRKVVQLTFIF